MRQYLQLLSNVLRNGKEKPDRTGTGTISLFGTQTRYNLQQGFPLLTTKKVHFKSIVHELLFFLSGETNIKYLSDNNVKIWDAWALDGEIGPLYGTQWTSWPSGAGGNINQLESVIEEIKSNPNSRRLVVSAWNVSELPNMALYPCHIMFQFYVEDGKLSCQFYQRSADMFLGVPFNIASYALLTHMIAQVCGLKVGELIHCIGDTHIYSNHQDQVLKQLIRTPRELPQIKLDPTIENIFDFTYDDISLEGYNPAEGIKASVAV